MDGLALGIEIGGTKLQAALGTPAGEVLAQERGRAPAGEGAQAILAWFEQSVPRLLAEASSRGRTVTGMGVGFGGPVETATGTVLVSHQVSGWDGVPLRAWFEERFGLPTVVANDSNAAGWAEYCLGAGRGTRHFCYMNIGSGIGGALVMDGKLHDGQGFGAAEIGHCYVPDWTVREPGAADELERLCSGWSIERRFRAAASTAPNPVLARLCGGDRERITCAMVAEAARAGDPECLEALDRVAQTAGLALANVITLVHPERVALGGGVALMGEVLLEPLRRHVDARVFEQFRGRYDIVPCALGESVVVAGALLLAPRPA
ncbi:MAG TPA: ROK family protein [Candidatus Hydrogenedentes bacterium]|nr:ROK family protein [Candidatus Hydrogenedentota bacterium]HQM34618.1 ROK family protein [Candidatus Hydrogenedentota bacterium]